MLTMHLSTPFIRALYSIPTPIELGKKEEEKYVHQAIEHCLNATAVLCSPSIVCPYVYALTYIFFFACLLIRYILHRVKDVCAHRTKKIPLQNALATILKEEN